jgi:S-adenosylmethionine:tRNA ribosyltransferase-isomerase
MKAADYDFFLPERLIAERPLERRDSSRLFVLRRDGSEEHRTFFELPSLLDAGDLLLINKTKVFPARLTGAKPSGGRVEILLVREVGHGVWDIMSRGKYTGSLVIPGGLPVHISEGRKAFFEESAGIREVLWEMGKMPLPPYIRRRPDEKDRETYQTVYAEVEGSIAAPTAGLHFTKELLDALAAKSIKIGAITLHVGTGTFRTVKTQDIRDHRMEGEFFELSPELVREIDEVKRRGNRVVAVGTTTTRAIEGFLSGRCEIHSANGTIRGTTDIFIYEGYRPKAVDALITNFHLPRSTPLMLTSVFSGRQRLLRAYQEAILREYRFFSYGDAMLVL